MERTAARTVALCAAGFTLIAAGMWYGPRDADDFSAFYRAAGLVSAHRSVYSVPLLSPEKAADAGGFVPYVRIPSYAVALVPLARLPYAAARGIWIALMVLAVVGCITLYPERRNRVAIALAFSFPLADALIVGQDISLVLLLVLAAMRFHSAGREFLAGLIASLLCIKITYLPAAGLVFLARSKRGTWGLLTGVAVQAGISFLAGGATWPVEYLSVLRNIPLDREPAHMPNIHEVVATLGLPAAFYTIGAVGLYLLFWFACRRVSVADGLILALALAVIASPHSKPYDGIVLIPLFLRVASLGGWTGVPAFIGLTPILYLMVLMGNRPVLLAGSALVVAVTLVASFRLYQDGQFLPRSDYP